MQIGGILQDRTTAKWRAWRVALSTGDTTERPRSLEWSAEFDAYIDRAACGGKRCCGVV
jgi:hypothetical protein